MSSASSCRRSASGSTSRRSCSEAFAPVVIETLRPSSSRRRARAGSRGGQRALPARPAQLADRDDHRARRQHRLPALGRGRHRERLRDPRPGLPARVSVIARDYPVIVALSLVFGVAVVLVNLLTDLAYARLDPPSACEAPARTLPTPAPRSAAARSRHRPEAAGRGHAGRRHRHPCRDRVAEPRRPVPRASTIPRTGPPQRPAATLARAPLRHRRAGPGRLHAGQLRAGQVDLTFGIVTTYVPLVLGVLLGALSGYVGGWVDTVVMRLVDFVIAFPLMVLVLAIVAILGAGLTGAYIGVLARGLGALRTPHARRDARRARASSSSSPAEASATPPGASSSTTRCRTCCGPASSSRWRTSCSTS